MAKFAKRQRAQAGVAAAVGIFTKAEAAKLVAEGLRHVHCSELGTKDPIYVATLAAAERETPPRYLWEPSLKTTEVAVTQSVDRHEIFDQLISRSVVEVKSQLSEKVGMVLEELLSNAIFHAFQSNGKEKYSRSSEVNLKSHEAIKVRFAATEDGCFLEVSDTGGTLGFESVAESLKRCYMSDTQIQSKESGAGLGIYMVFETVSHLKIVNEPNKKTVISCWIADRRSENPKSFSFNYFGGKGK
jgi:anti-sigma regulatory factor (Ser/Thr protein kinase)